MFTMMVLINILLMNIILILAQMILVQKKNSAFGHATNKRAKSAA